jgi:hypothetical protein
MIITLFWISLAVGILLTGLAGGGLIGLIAYPIGIFAALASFITVPTLVLYAFSGIFSIKLDYGQMVVFIIFSTIFVLSLFTYIGVKLASKPAETLSVMGVSSLILVAIGLLLWLILLIANYGFHAEFPGHYLAWLSAGSKE